MKRHQIAVAVTGAVVLAMAGGNAAFGHVDPAPTEIPPGELAAVSFTAEEECPAPGTTGMLFAIPEGVASLTPIEKEGWTTASTVDGLLFTRSGPVDDSDDDLTFQIAFTAPAAEGTLDFPVVQQCPDGSAIRWIEVPVEGQPEPENRVPQVAVVDGAPPATTAVPVTTEAPATTAAPTTTEAPATTEAATTTEAPTTTAPPETTAAPTTTVPAETTTIPAETTAPPTSLAADEDGDDGSNTGLILGLIALAIALAGAVAYVLSRRSKKGPGPDAGTAALGGAAAASTAAGAAAPTTVIPTTEPPLVDPTDPTGLPTIVPAPEPPAPLPPSPDTPPPGTPPPGSPPPAGPTPPAPGEPPLPPPSPSA